MTKTQKEEKIFGPKLETSLKRALGIETSPKRHRKKVVLGNLITNIKQRIDWKVIRISTYIFTFWNVEEICRSWENGWNYNFFFWELGKDYWLYWCLLAGIMSSIYLWSKIKK